MLVVIDDIVTVVIDSDTTTTMYSIQLQMCLLYTLYVKTAIPPSTYFLFDSFLFLTYAVDD